MMRLIDADAKIKMLLYDEEHEEQITREMTVEEALDAYTEDGCPTTVDAEPIRHGKLLRTEAYPHKLYCGECYNTLIPNDEAVEQNWMLKPKYCMYCGAKLDKEGTP